MQTRDFKLKRFIRNPLWLVFFFSLIVNIPFILISFGSPLDFGSFYAAGEFASQGENPYSTNSPLIFRVEFPGINHFGLAPNLNPPISIIIFEQIIFSSLQNAVITWRIVSIILYIALAIVIQRSDLSNQKSPTGIQRLMWILALAGFWHCIQLGQIYIPMLAIAILAWTWLKQGRDILGGIAIGFLIAIKPNFIVWALILLAARNWKSFLAAGITSLGISVIPLFLYGPEIYIQWIEASAQFAPDLLIFPGNNSFQGLTARFGFSEIGAVLGVSLLIGILLFVFIKKIPQTAIHGIGIISSLLLSPIAWTGYTLLTIPIFLEKEKWNVPYWVSALILVTPFAIILNLFQTSFLNFVFWGWFYGWALVILLGTQVWELRNKGI
jgi:hypothetical protein